MWTAYDLLIASLLAAWMAFSILAQRITSSVFRFDVTGLVPNCRFFAPKPVSLDVTIHIRQGNSSGDFSAWRPVLEARKEWWCFVWNPEHRLKKALFDLTEMLQLHGDNTETRHLTFPYLALLNLTLNHASARNGFSRVQFIISGYAGYEDSVHNIIFLSNLHES
jgi:hypothetical protein